MRKFMPKTLTIILLALLAIVPPTTADAEDNGMTARGIFTQLPASIFENTAEGLSDADKQQLLTEGHTEFWEIAGETEDVIVFAALPFRDSAVALRLFRNTADGSVEAAIGTEVRGYTLTIHYLCPKCRAAKPADE